MLGQRKLQYVNEVVWRSLGMEVAVLGCVWGVGRGVSEFWTSG